jgi:hypothetical protein
MSVSGCVRVRVSVGVCGKFYSLDPMSQEKVLAKFWRAASQMRSRSIQPKEVMCPLRSAPCLCVANLYSTQFTPRGVRTVAPSHIPAMYGVPIVC